MCNTTDIQLRTLIVYDIAEPVQRRDIRRFLNQIHKQLLAQDIGFQRNRSGFGVSAILLQRQNTLLLVQIHNITVYEGFLCIIHILIQHGDIRTAFDMRIQQRTEVLTENKVTRCQNNVRIIGILDCLHVVHIRIAGRMCSFPRLELML